MRTNICSDIWYSHFWYSTCWDFHIGNTLRVYYCYCFAGRHGVKYVEMYLNTNTNTNTLEGFKEVHNKMPMLPSEETPIMTARILWGSVTTQNQSQLGNQNSLVPAWSRTKEQKGNWPMVCLVLIHPLALSKQRLWSLPGPLEYLLLSVFISN